MTKVDLIIPTHNGIELLLACLASLRQSRFQDFTLIVFDDASAVPVREQVHDVWPTAQVIRSDTNVGLATGFNMAIDASSSPYVGLLNDDTEVDPGWLGALVACADRNPFAGSIASKLRLISDRQLIHSAGDFYSVRGMPGNRGAWATDFGQFDRETSAFSACGGAALYRRSALDAVRLPNRDVFDRRLFMYCEDVDLGWRLQVAGWPCSFEPQAVVYHHLSATGGGRFASYYVSRNVWLVMARSVPREVLRPFRMRIAAHHLGRFWHMLLHMREPSARAALRGSITGIALALRGDRAASVSASESHRLRAIMHSPRPPFRGV